MADYSGRKIRYGLAKEATRGTWVTPTYWLRWETADFFDAATTIYNQSAIGVLDRYSGAEIVERSATGQLAGKVTDRSIGLILFGVFGSHSVATHAGESIVYDHTFTESQSNASQSLAVTRLDPNGETDYNNGMVGSFELEAKAGDFVRHTTMFTTFPGVSGSTSTSTYVAENEFTGQYVTAALASSVGGLSSATAIPINSVKLTMNKNLEPYYIIGQNGPNEIFSQTTEVSGEFVLRYTDETYFNLRFNNTIQAVQIAISNTNVTIGASTHPTLTFTMPQCFLNDFKPEQSIDGMVTQTVSFTATYSLSAAYEIQAVLTNLVSTY
jgi:hypothetical protein